jgi:hypothetical protein
MILDTDGNITDLLTPVEEDFSNNCTADEFALEDQKEGLDNSFELSMLAMHCHWFCT